MMIIAGAVSICSQFSTISFISDLDPKTVESEKSANDRFIPLRKEVSNFHVGNAELEKEHVSIQLAQHQHTDFLNLAKFRNRVQNYQGTLRIALLPKTKKILHFFPPKPQPICKVSGDDRRETWPVKGRKKPVIEAPYLILDMPQFDCFINHQVADWSSQNCLATIFEGEVHIWSNAVLVMSEKEVSTEKMYKYATCTGKRVHFAIKWNPTGTFLAIALTGCQLGIWDHVAKKMLTISSGRICLCSPTCWITCMEWLDARKLIVGCNSGTLKVISKSLCLLTNVPRAHNSIVSMAASSNKKYLATSGVDRTVKIWSLPDLKGQFSLKFNAIIRAMAWHPWKYGLIAIGLGYSHGLVTIWNVLTKQCLASEESSYRFCAVDCLTFNPVTAELVVSYYLSDTMNDLVNGETIIAVLKNINCASEELRKHDGRVLYLMWGHGGKCLASAGADENLCFWNFFETHQKKKAMETKRSVLSLYNQIR